jgi:3-deoxy-D-arabino-heptulosonate 7-phosphate (DAHP) synthase
MEVMLPEHVERLKQEVLAYANDVALLLWIGSRNQNHLVQRQIAAAVKGIDHIKLMIKNQPWREMKHWAGIVSHVQDEGLPKEQLLLCHRGFAPWDKEQSELRNIPDLPMAEQIKSELQLPMILDPSHMGGAVHLVKQLARDFIDCDWVDGLMIEVHPCPEQALTDGQQQLTWEELRSLLAVRSKQRVPRGRAKPIKERAVV